MGSNALPAQIPTSFGHGLRACLRCRLVKTFDQFRESGCENCPFFKMDEDQERVVDCKFVPGVYTLAVSEALLEDLQNLCEDEHVQTSGEMEYENEEQHRKNLFLSIIWMIGSSVLILTCRKHLKCSNLIHLCRSIFFVSLF